MKLKPACCPAIVATFFLFFIAIASHAQLVADGATASINGITNTIVGGLRVGTNSSFTTLIITNGGYVTNSGVGEIGFQNTARTNQVIVTGTNSVWSSGAFVGVGIIGDFNRLVVTNGGRVNSTGGTVGDGSTSFGNTATITGAGSLWSLTSTLTVGDDGSTNGIVVSSGGKTVSNSGQIGNIETAHDNYAVIADAGSSWLNNFQILVGAYGSNNSLIITNGGVVANTAGHVGFNTNSGNNRVLVTGANSIWTNRTDLFVGELGSSNQLMVTDAGTVIASNLYLGFSVLSSNNLLNISGGNVIVTNAPGTSATEIRRGTFTLNSGLLLTEKLLLTNGTQSQFIFNGGSLQVRNMTNATSNAFVVGNGASSATLELFGNGTNRFLNGLQIANNALLKGNGLILGNVTNSSGGTLAPGASIGKLTMTGNLVLAAGCTNVFEINQTSATNDVVTGLSSVTYGGRLVVANLSGSLTNGDGFKLFNATNYIGSFSAMDLPTLSPGLGWTNTLATDGLIQVVAVAAGDRFWVASGGTFGNSANWLNALVAGPGDRANFTNAPSYQVSWATDASVADAYFTSATGTVSQAVGSFAWTVTNDYIIAPTVGSTGAISHVSGVLSVTHPAGTARMIVGGSGKGTATFTAGNASANNLLVGLEGTSSNNFVSVPGGSLNITNAMGTGITDVRRGTVTVSSDGFLTTDRLLLRNF